MLALKTETQVEREMIRDFLAAQDRVRDLNTAAAWRAFLGATAKQAAALWEGVRQAMGAFYIGEATGLDLDRRAADFGIVRLPALASAGTLLFSGVPATVVPSGFRVAKPGTEVTDQVTYATTAGGAIPGGGTLELPAEAESVGSTSNAAPNRITIFVSSPPAGLTAVTNSLAFDSGRDIESDADLRARVVLFWESLARGTERAMVREARAVPGVFAAFVRRDSAGEASVIINTGSNPASGGLITRVTDRIRGNDTAASPGCDPLLAGFSVVAMTTEAFNAAKAAEDALPSFEDNSRARYLTVLP